WDVLFQKFARRNDAGEMVGQVYEVVGRLRRSLQARLVAHAGGRIGADEHVGNVARAVEHREGAISAGTGDFSLQVKSRDRGVQIDRGLDERGTKARMSVDLQPALPLEGVGRAADGRQYAVDERTQGMREGDVGIV